ncbi:hypothetical protein ACHAXM_001746, partial [Skeletonema potamos]
FIGYAKLAEWAFKEGIYKKSLEDKEGQAFLVGMELEDNPNMPFNSTNTLSSVRKRTHKVRSADNDNANQTKKGRQAFIEQLVAEFEDEEKRIANKIQAAKPAAAKANDPSGDDDDDDDDDMEGSSFGGGDANDDGYENDEDDGDECRKNDETEEEQPEAYSTTDNDDDDEKDEQQGSKPKRVPTETTQQIPSQENDGDVSGLKDNVNGTARGGEVGAGNQDILNLNEMEELKAELKA